MCLCTYLKVISHLHFIALRLISILSLSSSSLLHMLLLPAHTFGCSLAMRVKRVIIFLHESSIVLLDSQGGARCDIAEGVQLLVELLLLAFPRLVDFVLKHSVLIRYRVGVDVLVVRRSLSILIIVHDQHALLSRLFLGRLHQVADFLRAVSKLDFTFTALECIKIDQAEPLLDSLHSLSSSLAEDFRGGLVSVSVLNQNVALTSSL